MARPNTAIPRRTVFYSVTSTAWTTPAGATWVELGSALMAGSEIGDPDQRTYDMIDRAIARGGLTLNRVLNIESINTAAYDALKALGASDFVVLRMDRVDQGASIIFGGAEGATISRLHKRFLSADAETQGMMVGFSAAGLEHDDIEKTAAFIG